MVLMRPLPIEGTRRIVVLTGAGISVASGLRPYRGPGGLWTDGPERMREATLAAAEKDPSATWRSFAPLRRAVQRATPNAAHHALRALEERLDDSATLIGITQNIDGLHQAAGSRRVVELHGNLRRTRCSSARCSLEPFDDGSDAATAPPCPLCGAPLRPDIVLFDEPMPAREEWESKRALRDCDLFLAVGTSGTVSPASNFVRSADYAGARTVYVNLEPLSPPNPAFHETVVGRAEEILPALLGSE